MPQAQVTCHDDLTPDETASTVPKPVRFVTVHGTGSGRPEDDGDRWWQRGSPFQQELADRLKLKSAQVEVVPFHWEEGPNSETGRRAAGLALYAQLKAYDKAGENYHLIGHSHGGSVIYAALLHSLARGRRLDRLKSWCTVGTPFLDFGPTRFLFSQLGSKGLTIYATAVGLLLVMVMMLLGYFLASTPKMKVAKEVFGEDFFWSVYSNYVIPFGVLGILSLTGLYAYAQFRGGTYSQGQKKKVSAVYGDRWLGLWHAEDEAISALRNVRILKGPIIPSNFLVPFISGYLPILMMIMVCLSLGYGAVTDQKPVAEDFRARMELVKKNRSGHGEYDTVTQALQFEIGPRVNEWTRSIAGVDVVPVIIRTENAGISAAAERPSAQTIAIAIYLGWIAFWTAFAVIAWTITWLGVAAFGLIARGVGWPLAKLIDTLVWSSVRQQAWGADRRGEFVQRVGSHPPAFDERFSPLPAAIAGMLSLHSEKNAILTLEKVRELLGMKPNRTVPSDIRAELSNHLTWRELIHTTYFEVPEFVDLAAYGLHKAGLAELDAEYWQESNSAMVEEWLGTISAPSALRIEITTSSA